MEFGITVLPDPPASRFVELVQHGERAGFHYAYTYDSHLLWQAGEAFLAAAAAQTERIKLGYCVTNPGTREPTVNASFHATLHSMSGGRAVCLIGRGDSARRTIGYQPVKMAEFEAACVMMKGLMNGEAVEWNGKHLRLGGDNPLESNLWQQSLAGLPELELWVAGYGPKALAVAGRVATGVVIQLADPEIIQWLMGIARRAAEEAGRDPDLLKPIVCAPAVVTEDMEEGRNLTRWFPAMVSNHVADLMARYDRAELPPALVDYLDRREFYNYKDHSRVGAAHGEFVDDVTCDRFSVIGPIEEHVRRMRELEAIGVAQYNIYLMTGRQEETLDLYGEHVIPALATR